MKKAAVKIKDNSGVSLLMALLFVSVAIFVSAVITAAASTSSRTVIYKNDMQKAYLTVYSAAEFISSDIQQYTYNKGDAASVFYKDAGNASLTLFGIMNEAISTVNETGKDSPATSFTVRAEGSNGVKFDDVTVKFQMTRKYEIKIDLSLADSRSSVGKDTDYDLSMKFNNSGGKWSLKGNINKGQRIVEAQG